MSFGLRSGERAATTTIRERRGVSGASTLPALLASLASLTLLAGCGGGGSSPSPSPSGNGNNATVSGTVVDPLTNSPDPDAVVAFGSNYTITGNSGNFSLSIPSGTVGTVIFYGKAARDSSGNLVIGSNGLPTSVSTNDSNTYTGVGYYPVSSRTQVNLFSTGIPVASQSGGATVNLGSVGLFTQNDPPLPPSGF